MTEPISFRDDFNRSEGLGSGWTLSGPVPTLGAAAAGNVTRLGSPDMSSFHATVAGVHYRSEQLLINPGDTVAIDATGVAPVVRVIHDDVERLYPMRVVELEEGIS